MPYTEGTHNEECLISEAPGERSREVVTVLSGNSLEAGDVFGVAATGAGTATAAAGNTGNGTFGAITVGTGAKPGTYHLTAIAATKLVVEDPDGIEVGVATTGSAFAKGGLGFTITAGATAFVAGDSFTLAVAAGSGKAALIDPDGTDGTQNAAGVMLYKTDATDADKDGTAVVRDAEVRTSSLNFSTLDDDQTAAAKAQLAALGIICRDAI